MWEELVKKDRYLYEVVEQLKSGINHLTEETYLEVLIRFLKLLKFKLEDRINEGNRMKFVEKEDLFRILEEITGVMKEL